MRTWKSGLALLLSCMLVLTSFPWLPARAVAANLNNVLIDLAVNKPEVESGEQFTYTVSFSFSAVDAADQFDGVRIELPLPAGVEYINSFTPNYMTEPVVTGTVESGLTLSYAFNSAPAAGTSYTLQANARFSSYVTANLTSGTTEASIVVADDPATPDVDESDRLSTDEVTVTALASSNWQLNKTQRSPAPTPKTGGEVEYGIELVNTKGGHLGNLEIRDITIVDELPAGSVFVAATDGGQYDAASHTVTWSQGPDFGPGSSLRERQEVAVIVSYPEDVFQVTDTVTNTALTHFSPVGESSVTLNSVVSHSFTTEPLDNGSGIYKRVSTHHREISPGQTVDFYIGGFRNMANVPLGEDTSGNRMMSAPDQEEATDAEDDATAPTPPATDDQVGAPEDDADQDGAPSTDQPENGEPAAGGSAPDAQASVGDQEASDSDSQTAGDDSAQAADRAAGDEAGASSTADATTTDTAASDAASPSVASTEDGSSAEQSTDTSAPDSEGDSANGESTDAGQSQPGEGSQDSGTVDAPEGEVEVDAPDASSDDDTAALPEDTEARLTLNAAPGTPSAIITDMTPAPLQLREVATAVFAGISEYRMEYTVDGGATWTPWSAPINASASGTIDVSALQADGVRFVFEGALPVAFRQMTEFRLTYALDASYAVAPAGELVTNTVDLAYWFEGTEVNKQDSEQIKLHQPRPLVELKKEVLNGTQHIPGNVVDYRITVRNSDRSSAPLTNPIVMDVLPEELELIEGSWKLIDVDGLGLPALDTLYVAPALATETYDGITKDYRLIRSKFAAPVSLPVGKSYVIEFQAKVTSYTPVGQILNRAELTSSDPYLNDYHFPGGVVNPADDIYDHDGDGSTADPLIFSRADIYVNRQAEVSSVKQVRGELDADWTDLGETTPGGRVDYKLTVRNEGNVAVKDIVIVDVLPRVGDTGVIAGGARNSRWSTVLTSDVQLPANATVLYHTEANVKMNTTTGWLTTPPVDMTKVTALKFIFDSTVTIEPGDEMSFTWQTRAPFDAPTGADQIAWSSFGHQSVQYDNTPILPAEPPKVGVRLSPNVLGELGNYVWADLNENGLQDDWVDWNGTGTQGDGAATDPYGVKEQPGINGVLVELLDAATNDVLQQTLTSNDSNGNPGYYLFTALPAGSYKVRFHLPADGITDVPFTEGWTLSKVGNDDTIDSDVAKSLLAAETTDTIVLAEGEKNHDIDAGLIPPKGMIGDYVWLDSNRNGIQDASESGVAGVTVELLNAANQVLDTTTTDATGHYLFDDLLPGRYKVAFTPPTDHVFTRKTQGNDRALDSNVGTSVGTNENMNQAERRITDIIVLPLGGINLTIDAGLVPLNQLASLGDYVWKDMNNNGIQDAGELPVSGMTVTLYNQSDNQVAQTKTDAAGFYLFEHLPPGSYTVQFTLPADHMFSPKGQGSNRAVDSNANANGRTDAVVLAAGQHDPTIDAGIVPLAAIGDYVWMDRNENGIQDAGEPGINDVTVRLYQGAYTNIADLPATPQATQQTREHNGKDGYYYFGGLAPSVPYTVVFERPQGYRFTVKEAGADRALDSNADQATGMAAPVTPQPNEQILTVDAGLIELSAIGNYVWIDANGNGLQDDWLDWNGNGIQDAGEEHAGVNGVTVQLLNAADDSVLDEQVTADHNGEPGYYLFDELPSGTYKVKFILPTAIPGIDTTFDGWTIAGAGTDRELDSDADPLSGVSGPIELGVGQRNLSIDAGLQLPLGELGDYVWFDTNGDGIQDASEAGVSGVKVRLYDTTQTDAIAETTTDTDGAYLFSNLKPGQYQVEFELPDQRLFTLGGQGTDRTLDSNVERPASVDTRVGRTELIPLGLGQRDLTIDAGLIGSGAIGDYVWIDRNNNGIQDAGELGLAGVTVRLYDGAGTELTSQVTDAQGHYLFDNLYAGEYEVAFELPDGYQFSPRQQGDDRALDSDADRSDRITLGVSERNLTIDAGVVPLASVGDYVWMDRNENGLQDATEAGINGVTVHLYDASDTLIRTTVTADNNGASGYYLFDGLSPGTYRIGFVLPGGYVFTEQHAVGGTSASDSDADRTSGRTAQFTLQPDEHNRTIDAGLIRLVALGDYVWEDLNGNGIQDAGEPGINGVTVTLLDASDTVIGTQVTADNGAGQAGYYRFDDLMPGTYKVRFDAPASMPAHLFTHRYKGAEETDSNVDQEGNTELIVLVAGEDDLTIDAGLVASAAVGDYVWVDLNGNGLQDGGEEGKNGVKVELYDSTGTKVAEQETRNNGSGQPGYYHFDRLLPGEYSIRFTLPTGYTFTTKGAGDTARDSDAGLDGRVEPFVLQPGEDNRTIDAGLRIIPPAYIPFFGGLGDYVWLDANGDGIQDADEQGVDGVTVHLYNRHDALVSTTVTTTVNGRKGYYEFKDLPAGEAYRVKFELPDGYRFTKRQATSDTARDSNADEQGWTESVVVRANDTIRTIDAGLIRIAPAALGDYVWEDLNGNGIQDTGEPGINGVLVELYDEQGELVAKTSTASDAAGKPGYYLFEELTPGAYTVKFHTPDGYRATVRGAGRDPKRDSDAGEGGVTPSITLAEGERNLTVDAGYVRIARAQLGDYVWYDKDNNGIQDAGERGINGVRVELYDAQGQLLDTVVTADDAAGNRGYYLFDDLLPGEYTVKFVRPGGMKFTTRLAGDDRTVDSNADGSGFSEPVNLGEGERNRTIDAGLLIDPDAPEPLEIPLEELEEPLNPGGIPTIPVDPEEPTTPVTPAVPGEETPVSPPPVVSTPLHGQLPKTGESAPVLPWVGSAMMLLAIALWVRERRERRQRKL